MVWMILAVCSIAGLGYFALSRGGQAPGQGGVKRWPVLSMCSPGLAFFDPDLDADIRLTTYQVGASQVVLEVDRVEVLEEFLKISKGGQSDFLVFINLGDPDASGSRAYKWFDKKRATQLGGLLKGGPFKKLMLVATSFEPGSLQVLAEAIGRPMEMLSLLYYFSGDDLTDYPEVCGEIGIVAQKLRLERLCLLTGEFNGTLDKKLAQALKPVSTLKVAQVLKKDDAKTWPRIPTPERDAALRR